MFKITEVGAELLKLLVLSSLQTCPHGLGCMQTLSRACDEITSWHWSTASLFLPFLEALGGWGAISSQLLNATVSPPSAAFLDSSRHERALNYPVQSGKHFKISRPAFCRTPNTPTRTSSQVWIMTKFIIFASLVTVVRCTFRNMLVIISIVELL